MSPEDIAKARDSGVDDADIVDWAQMGAIQTWFVIQADASGIPLTDDAVAGPVVGRTRDEYHGAGEGLTASDIDEVTQDRCQGADDNLAWVAVDTSNERYRRAAAQANARWGFVPNLITAMSVGRSPDLTPASLRLLELLEEPQSSSLSHRQHAMVRALVAALNRSDYSTSTIRAQIGDDALYENLQHDYRNHGWSEVDRAVLDFACKVARNAYKITEKDAECFRSLGLGEEAYVDTYCTAAAQLCVDRMANALGVLPDREPVLK